MDIKFIGSDNILIESVFVSNWSSVPHKNNFVILKGVKYKVDTTIWSFSPETNPNVARDPTVQITVVNV